MHVASIVVTTTTMRPFVMGTEPTTAAPDIARNATANVKTNARTTTKANAKADRKALTDAIKIMETLYDGWVQAVEKLKKEELNK